MNILLPVDVGFFLLHVTCRIAYHFYRIPFRTLRRFKSIHITVDPTSFSKKQRQDVFDDRLIGLSSCIKLCLKLVEKCQPSANVHLLKYILTWDYFNRWPFMRDVPKDRANIVDFRLPTYKVSQNYLIFKLHLILNTYFQFYRDNY